MWYGFLSHMASFFTIEEVDIRLKIVATTKVGDRQSMKTKMLKWPTKDAHVQITNMFYGEICKVGGLQSIKTKILKWTRNEAHVWISNMFNSEFHNVGSLQSKC